MIVVNRMDKENAAYEATVDALREAFARKPIAVAVPIGAPTASAATSTSLTTALMHFDDRGRATDVASRTR